MANTYVTPSMGLILPVPGVQPGPEYAIDQNSSFTLIDTHNHTSGKGVQVPSSGLNINSALSFNNNNLISARSVAFNSAPSPAISSTDVGCLYLDSSGNLVFNTLEGAPVVLTSGSSIAGGTISGLPASPPYSTAGVAFGTTTGSGIYTFTQSTLVNATLAMGSAYLTYPGFYPTPSGNGIVLRVPSTIASQYSLTLPALPGQTNVMTLSSTGVISSITYDAVGQGMTATGANAIAASMTSTGTGSIAGTMTAANANTILGKVSVVGATQADLVGSAMTLTGANAIAASMTSIGTGSISGTMSVANANTIFGKVSVFPTASADAIAAAITTTGTTSLASTTTAANANTILGKVSSVAATQANLVGSAMTSTGSNAVAASMTSTGSNAIAASMSSIGTASLAGTMTASDANTILGKVSAVAATQANLVGSAMTSTGADAIASAITTTGTTSLAGTMTAANANTILGKVSAVASTQADLVGSAMTSTGSNAIAASMTSTGTTSLAATMTAANANTVLGKVSAVGATQADLVGSAMTSTGANAVAQARTRSTGTTVGVGGVAISASSGGFPVSSITPTTVCTCTITTSGRPVRLSLILVGTNANPSFIKYNQYQPPNITPPEAYIYYVRDLTVLSVTFVGDRTNDTPYAIPYEFVDVVGAGTYTYTLQASVGHITDELGFYSVKLAAYEL